MVSKIATSVAELTATRCFQEHLLAPRMLHYTDRELGYHFRESRTCECGGLGQKSWRGQVPRPIHFGELWENIFQAYTRTRLTYDHDILLALSGVSRLMQTYNPSGFYAGLWGVDILYQLAWRSQLQNEEYTPPRRPECYTAPSFSWASRIGPVSFPY